MNFWNIHNIALIKLREEVVQFIGEFQRKNLSMDKNYHKRLNRAINKKFGKQANILTALSVAKSIKSLNQQIM